ncbi:MAG: sigma-70 family RNA polymerase sigma factor [Planctomycetota bacterium]
MTESPAPPDLGALLANASWVRALARRLVLDGQLAEDVAQEAWLAATRRSPRHASNPRAWLAQVVGNAARRLCRADARRAARERVVAHVAPPTHPAAADVVEQAETQQRVVAAVLALAEPYRSTLLQTFFQGLGAVEVARAQGVPPATVRSRVHRGLAQLRTELAGDYGSEGAWRSALLPLGVGTSAGASVATAGLPVAGGLLMQKSTLAAAVLGVATLTALAVGVSQAGPQGGAVAPPPDRSAVGVAVAAAAAGHEDPTARGVEVTRPAREVVGRTMALVGRVLSAEGRPIEDAAVEVRGGDRGRGDRLGEGRSDAGGAFRVELAAAAVPGAPARCRVRAAGFYPVSLRCAVGAGDVEIRLHRACEVFGTVLHAQTRAPIEGALVTLGKSAVRTDAEGRYELAEALRGAALQVRVEKAGFVGAAAPVDGAGSLRVARHFELQPGAALPLRVVDAIDERPIAGAEVRHFDGAEPAMFTDAEGGVPLSLAPGEDLALRVRREGYAELEWLWDAPAPPDAEALTLRLLPLGWVTGTVRDAKGGPIAGAWVFATQPEAARGVLQDLRDPVGLRRQSIPGDDALRPPTGAGGGKLWRHLVSWSWDDYVQVHRGEGFPTVALPGALDPLVGGAADENGRFALPVLPLSTPYTVHAGAHGWQAVQRHPVRVTAATPRIDLDLHLVRGAIVRGLALRNDLPWRGGTVSWRRGEERGGFVTPDEEGRFALSGVPAGRVTIAARDRFAGVVGAPVAVTLELGEEREVELSWRDEVAAIRGRITTAAGARPLAGIEVSAHVAVGYSNSVRAKTDDDGEYELPVPGGQTYEVMVWRKPLRWRRHEVAAGSVGVDFDLPESGTLLLQLVDEQTGAALLSGAVSARYDSLAWRARGTKTYDYAEGERRTGGVMAVTLPVGPVDLALDFSEDGYVPRRLRDVAVAASAAAAPLRVSLQRGHELRLQLADAEALRTRRQQGAAFFLLGADELSEVQGPFPTQGGGSNFNFSGTHLWLARPGLSGRYIVPDDSGGWGAAGLAPGRYCLRAFPANVRFTPEWIDVRADAVVDVTWTGR